MTDAELRAIEASTHSLCYSHPVFAAHVRELVAEVRKLRDELARVTPFLAIHGVKGYSVERHDGEVPPSVKQWVVSNETTRETFPGDKTTM